MENKYDLLNNIDSIIDSIRRAFLRQLINDATEELNLYKSHTFDCLWFKSDYGVYGCAYNEYINEIRFSADRSCDF